MVLTDLHTQYITNDNGNKTAVIIPIKEFEELLEDIQDLAMAAERKNEDVISHENLIIELKQDGLI